MQIGYQQGITTKGTVATTVRIKPDHIAGLDQIAKENGVTRTDVMRFAVNTYLARRGIFLPANLTAEKLLQTTNTPQR